MSTPTASVMKCINGRDETDGGHMWRDHPESPRPGGWSVCAKCGLVIPVGG